MWVAVILGIATCRGAGCDDDGVQPIIVIGQMQLDAVTHDERGRPKAADVDMRRIVGAALDDSPRLALKLAQNGQSHSTDRGARLRLEARVSRDTAARILHVFVKGRIDRTATIVLSWSADARHPFDDTTTGPLPRQLVHDKIDEVVRSVISALDVQARTAQSDSSELVKVLSLDDQPARLAAARVLGMRKHVPSVIPLCEALNGSVDQVGDGIVDALADLGDERAIECLARWSGDEPQRLSHAIRVSSLLGGSKGISFLEDIESRGGLPQWIREKAKQGLTQYRSSGGEHTEDGHNHDEELQNDPLIRALDEEEQEVRIGAIALIISQRRTDAIEPLCGLLEHDDPETVEAAFGALTELGDPHAVPCLVRWSSQNERRLPLVIEALSMIGGQESRTVLELLAREHQTQLVRELAQDALNRTRSTP